jgi:hypothetical protein
VSADDPAGTGWDVQVAGHLCVDLEPGLLDAAPVTPGSLTEVGRLELRLGGCVANTGSDLAALGLRTLLVTSLGDDVLAGTVAALVDTIPGADARAEIVPGATTSYSIVVQPSGTDRAFWHHVGANASFDGRQVDVAAAPLLHVGYLPLLPRLTARAGAGLVRLFQEARSAAVTTSIDMCVVQPGRTTCAACSPILGSRQPKPLSGCSRGAQRLSRSPTDREVWWSARLRPRGSPGRRAERQCRSVPCQRAGTTAGWSCPRRPFR